MFSDWLALAILAAFGAGLALGWTFGLARSGEIKMPARIRRTFNR